MLQFIITLCDSQTYWLIITVNGRILTGFNQKLSWNQVGEEIERAKREHERG